MVLLAVQRSGRTVMRATTRSLSASTKVTPFKSAKGIFIERTFSSSVMGTPGFLQAISQSAGWNVRVNDAMTSEVMITQLVRPSQVLPRCKRDRGAIVFARSHAPMRKDLVLCD